MKRLSNILLYICFLFLLIIPLPSFALDAEREVLGNGLTVLFFERHNLPIVKVELLIKASKVDEPSEKAGLANITASMLTEGTKNRTSLQISEEIEFMGADLGVSSDNDYTTISLFILKREIEKGFDIFSDVLLNPTFPEDELKQKKKIVKGSLKQSEESPSFLANRAFLKEVFGTHPYSRIIEGTPESIDLITREDIIKFYRQYYQPERSILSVVGDLSHDELMNLIDSYLKAWKNTEFKIHKRPDRNGHFIKKIITIDKDLTQATIMLGHKGIKRDNPDYYAISVMNYILGGGGFSSRLMQTIRDDMGLAYDVHSSFSSNKHGGYFKAAVQTKNKSANKVIEEILNQIERIKKNKVSEQEINDAKSYLTGSFPRRIDTMSKIASFLVGVEYYGLGLDYDIKYVDYINAITRDDIKRVAEKYLNNENYILVVVGNIEEANISRDKY